MKTGMLLGQYFLRRAIQSHPNPLKLQHLVIWDGPVSMNVCFRPWLIRIKSPTHINQKKKPYLLGKGPIPCFTLTIRDMFKLFVCLPYFPLFFTTEVQYYNPNDYQTWVEIQWSHPLWYNRRGHRLDVKNPSMVTWADNFSELEMRVFDVSQVN